MRIAVSAEGGNLDSPLGLNFARCRYFVFVDIETMESEAMANEAAAARGGAGVKAARALADAGVQAVLTGMIGPNAFAALQSAGIPVFAVSEGTVLSALRSYRAAHLSPLSGATAAPRSAMRGGGSGERRIR